MPDMSAAGLPHTLVEVLMAALSQAVPKAKAVSYMSVPLLVARHNQWLHLPDSLLILSAS